MHISLDLLPHSVEFSCMHHTMISSRNSSICSTAMSDSLNAWKMSLSPTEDVSFLASRYPFIRKALVGRTMMRRFIFFPMAKAHILSYNFSWRQLFYQSATEKFLFLSLGTKSMRCSIVVCFQVRVKIPMLLSDNFRMRSLFNYLSVNSFS